jgi:hypothetical protein
MLLEDVLLEEKQQLSCFFYEDVNRELLLLMAYWAPNNFEFLLSVVTLLSTVFIAVSTLCCFTVPLSAITKIHLIYSIYIFQQIMISSGITLD